MTNPPPLLPHELLWSAGARGPVHVSPDGRTLAYTEASDGAARLWVRPVDGGEPRQLSRDTGDHGIEQLWWAADSRHVIVARDAGGDEDYRLEAVDIASGAARTLIGGSGVRALVLGTDPEQPDLLAVAANDRDKAWYDVLHVSVSTGEMTRVAENDGFTRWAVDARLQPRAGVRPTDGGGALLQVREDGVWRTVREADPDDAFPLLFDVCPLAFSADGKTLYSASATGADTTGLVAHDLLAGSDRLVVRHAEGDVLWVAFHPVTGEPHVATIPTDRNQAVPCSPAGERDAAAISTALAGDWQLVSSDATGELWTVVETRDTGSAAYHLYRSSTGTLESLGTADPVLDEVPLAPMEPFSYTARDGLTVHGFVTFPLGVPRSDLPTVFMVHGGPANRWFWGYAPQVQFFANRGYCVVQMDYRGSIGYGKAHMAAGDRQWGRAMHDDVLDCIDFAVEQGWTDRERVGIWGTSYGGYEALVMVTQDPDVVRCAVPLVAPTNLVSLMASVPPYWQAERSYFERVLGTDEAEWWERSPLRLADQVRVPVLLFYGEKDPRVSVNEAQQLAKAFADAGVEHELHIFPDEGHALVPTMTTEHRAIYTSRLEAFLATHLGGRRSADNPGGLTS